MKRSTGSIESAAGRKFAKVVHEDAVEIRNAEAADADLLCALVAASKAHWGYSKEEMALFRADLHIDAERLAGLTSFVAWLGGRPVGVCTLDEVSAERLSVEHFFVAPDSLRRGIGSLLAEAAVEHARASGHSEIEIWSDPNATGFYRALGARLVGETPSVVPGRALPVFVLDVECASPVSKSREED